MKWEDYLNQFLWVIPLLVVDLLIPIFTFIPRLNNRKPIKVDGDLLGFVLTLLVANCMVAYLLGTFAYINVSINESPISSNIKVWSIIFALLFAIEGVIYYFWSQRDSKAEIRVSMSPNDYKELILNAEKGATIIWLIPKRIHVMFKSPEFIRHLAEKRFGVGSEYIQAYENEHAARRAALYQGLNSGLVIHELHNKQDMINYIMKKSHIGVDNIEKKYFIEMLTEWKRVMNQYSNNYCVRFTDKNLPLKYELIDKKKMVIHESVGTDSKDRLNAILIESSSIIQKISNDFLQIWESVPVENRSNQSAINFIETILMPLLS